MIVLDQLIDYNQLYTSLPFDLALASVASPNRDNKFDSTFDYFGNVQHQHSSGLLKNNCQYYYAKSVNLALTAVFHDDTDEAGGILSLASFTHSNHFALLYEFKGQESTPNYSSLPGGSGKMVPIETNTTIDINQL